MAPQLLFGHGNGRIFYFTLSSRQGACYNGERFARKEETRIMSENTKAFGEGMRDGVPIAVGYFAVALSIGMAARSVGLTPLQGLLASLLNNASAGEYAGFTVIAAGASYLEMALVILIANARYLLMSCALSQRLRPGTGLGHRLLMGFDVTDEIFAITIARPGWLNPFYTYGAMSLCIPCWGAGTGLGVIIGNLLPARAVSAFSVALYGMFLAVIIPPSRKSRVVACLVALSFAASYAASVAPGLSGLSAGTRTIILTVALAGGAALLFPVPAGEEAGKEGPEHA